MRLFSVRRLLSLEGVRYAAFLVIFVVLIGGAAFAAVEEDQSLSAWDGIWWALVTVTTVGDNDISVTTDAGRAIGTVVMLTGIGFIALVTGFMADRFIRQDVGEEVEKREDEGLVKLDAIGRRLERVERQVGGQP